MRWVIGGTILGGVAALVGWAAIVSVDATWGIEDEAQHQQKWNPLTAPPTAWNSQR